MNYDAIIDYLAAKVEEARREEFKKKASGIKDPKEAEILGRSFGIPELTEEEKKELLNLTDELPDDLLETVSGGNEDESSFGDILWDMFMHAWEAES